MRQVYAKLPTEQINPRTTRIDQSSTKEILRLISREDAQVAHAVHKQLNSISQAVNLSAQALKKGNRLLLIGAGTSGRLAVMEAAECPPSFHTKPSQIQAIMAGGKQAVFESQEGAEDDALAAQKEIAKRVHPGDIVVGIAASGITPYVVAALQTAKKLGCKIILITCNCKIILITRNKLSTDITVPLKVGPEVIAGSTRMKAATATKMVLNMLTTASMIRLGKVYENRMVDLQIKSRKLQERALRILKEVVGLNRKQALKYLSLSHGKVKVAILMAKKNLTYQQAIELLKQHQGFLGKILDAHPKDK